MNDKARRCRHGAYVFRLFALRGTRAGVHKTIQLLRQGSAGRKFQLEFFFGLSVIRVGPEALATGGQRVTLQPPPLNRSNDPDTVNVGQEQAHAAFLIRRYNPHLISAFGAVGTGTTGDDRTNADEGVGQHFESSQLHFADLVIWNVQVTRRTVTALRSRRVDAILRRPE